MCRLIDGIIVVFRLDCSLITIEEGRIPDLASGSNLPVFGKRAKYLGVTVTTHQNCKQSIENLTKSANNALGFMQRKL